MKHAVQTALMRRLRRIKQALFLFGEEQLCSRIRSTRCMSPWQCGHVHSKGFLRGAAFLIRSLVEQSAAERQHAGSSAAGEETEVGYGESLAAACCTNRRKNFFEARSGALPAVMGVVLPAETYLSS